MSVLSRIVIIIMKKLLLSLTLVSITLFVSSQGITKIQANIGGYKTGDTIKIADFLKLSEVSLNNEEYSIVSFVLLISDKDWDYEMMSKTKEITYQMYDAMSRMKGTDTKIRVVVFKDITVQSSGNKTTKIDNLVYKIKLE